VPFLHLLLHVSLDAMNHDVSKGRPEESVVEEVVEVGEESFWDRYPSTRAGIPSQGSLSYAFRGNFPRILVKYTVRSRSPKA
jgi:hypothetical protein